MAIPVAVAGAAVVGGVRMTTWLVRRHRAKTKTIVLVGPPAAGKTTLARLLSGDQPEPAFAASTGTTAGGAFEGRVPRSDRRVRALDMPGADGLASWKASIDSAKPDLVCIVLDFNQLLTSDEQQAAADRCVRHVKDMVKWRQDVAVVLTHTDQQSSALSASDQAVANPRVKPLLDILSTRRAVAGNLLDDTSSQNVLDAIWQWLA